MKTSPRLRSQSLMLTLLLTASPVIASTLVFQENFNGSGYTVNQPLPYGAGTPWSISLGASPPPVFPVQQLANDVNGQRPSTGNALRISRPNGAGSISGVYTSGTKLTDGGSYLWSFSYKYDSGASYIYLDTSGGNVFAGLYVNSGLLSYYSAPNGGVGVYTNAKNGSGGNISLTANTWYDISYEVTINTVGGNREVSSQIIVTSLDATDPLFSISLSSVNTTANFTNNIRMGISPQNAAAGTDFTLAEVSLHAIPEPGSMALMALTGLGLGGLVLRRKHLS